MVNGICLIEYVLFSKLFILFIEYVKIYKNLKLGRFKEKYIFFLLLLEFNIFDNFEIMISQGILYNEKRENAI